MGLRTATSTSTGLAFAALQYLAAAGLVTYVAGYSRPWGSGVRERGSRASRSALQAGLQVAVDRR